jgi:acetyl esterase/lipase
MAAPEVVVEPGSGGQLAQAQLAPRTDPRIKPELLAALAAVGLDGPAVPPPASRRDGADTVTQHVAEAHAGFEGLYEALANELPGDRDDITVTTASLTGVDGNEIALRIYRSPDTDAAQPGVVYIHGGGMTVLSAFNKVHRRWCEDLAAAGLVVIGVDFRNGYDADGLNPFPAGLNDCATALDWVDANREDLGITKVVLQGESGGANLVLATTLKAKAEGRLDRIDGVYATVPYISGAYGWDETSRVRELPSLVENDGYFLTCAGMDLLVATYDPTGTNASNPLCWPYFATEADLEGMPPHVIVVDELDPLRDEGLAYFRKLLRAGVPAVGRMNLGLTHAAELIFRQAVPADYFATVHDLKRFADSV